MAGGRGAMPPIVSKSSDFQKFNVSSEHFWTFDVCKDIGFDSYRKIL